MPGKRHIKWDTSTRNLIMDTTTLLQKEGMSRPPIRAVLYRLLDYPGWRKEAYNTLCRKLGE